MDIAVIERAVNEVRSVVHIADVILNAYVLDPAGISLRPDEWPLTPDVRILLPALKQEALAIRRRWGCDTVTPYVTFPPYIIGR